MFFLFLFLVLLLFLVLKYFFGYTIEEIIFGFLNIILDGLRKLSEFILQVFKNGNSDGLSL